MRFLIFIALVSLNNKKMTVKHDLMKHFVHYLVLTFVAELTILQIHAQEKGWIIPAIDSKTYAGAPVANGCIGIMPWKGLFEVKHVMLNSVFERISERDVSRAQMGINPFVLHLAIDNQSVNETSVTDWKQAIDMKHAMHQTTFCISDKAEVSYNIAALGNLPHSGLIEVKIKALKDLSFRCTNEMDFPNQLINKYVGHKVLNDLDFHQTLMEASAYTAYKTHRIAASSAFFSTSSGVSIQCDDQTHLISGNIKSGETVLFYLVGTICSSRDFKDPIGEVERQVAYISMTGINKILQGHYEYWADLWTSDIVVEGDLQAQRDIRFALFNLYSTIRKGSRLSTSPMGLSSQAYNGHVFWDSELWMYPPLLYMHPQIAKSMIDYRFDRLEKAIQKAHARGLEGALFPWESDDSGEESTPTWCLTGVLELHISADVAIAAFNYYQMTHDLQWLRTEGYPLIKEIAKFWVSKAEQNEDGSYSINNVIGANEYKHGADDNAFTNGAASVALRYASQAASICGETPPIIWTKIAQNIRFSYLENGVTKEHSTYHGEMIKQADVTLLGYPLNIVSAEQQKKDLNYYADKIDSINGPAMSFSSYSIQYARLGLAKKAYEAFRRSYIRNLRPPFNVFAETPTSNNAYFCTGAGGMLQAVICGFGGLDLTPSGIVQHKSVLPPHWTKLIIKGVGPNKETFVVSRSKNEV